MAKKMNIPALAVAIGSIIFIVGPNVLAERFASPFSLLLVAGFAFYFAAAAAKKKWGGR